MHDNTYCPARALSLGLLGQTKKEWPEKHWERHNSGTNSHWRGVNLQGFFAPCESSFLGKSPSQRGEAQREGRLRVPEGSQQKRFLTLLDDAWINRKHCCPLMLLGLGRWPTTKGLKGLQVTVLASPTFSPWPLQWESGVTIQGTVTSQVTLLIAWCKVLLSSQCLLVQARARGPGDMAHEQRLWAYPSHWEQRKGKAMKEHRGGREERCYRATCNDCHGDKHIVRAHKQPLKGNVSHFHWWGRRGRGSGE